jgi:hypothetical protein
MRFLRSVAGYRRMSKKRNVGLKQERNIFNPGQEVKEYQRIYLEYILRMSIHQILGSCLTTTLKQEEREVHH